eukprot:m.350955 g.350955  ORF g.350955 m.350955 type:complete len:58 (+) comp16161_c0_seq1:207-380(+)
MAKPEKEVVRYVAQAKRAVKHSAYYTEKHRINELLQYNTKHMESEQKAEEATKERRN